MQYSAFLKTLAAGDPELRESMAFGSRVANAVAFYYKRNRCMLLYEAYNAVGRSMLNLHKPAERSAAMKEVWVLIQLWASLTGLELTETLIQDAIDNPEVIRICRRC